MNLPFLSGPRCDGRCIFVARGVVICNVLSPRKVCPYPYYVCTLPKGHEGPHIACAASRHNLAHWEDGDAKVTVPGK